MIARTDLALELQEDMEKESRLDGICMKTKIYHKQKVKETKIVIEDERGSKALGKPIGTYITLECQEMKKNDFGYHEELSKIVSEQLELLVPKRKKILVAGLGNRKVTPDALGPLVIDHLFVTAHLKRRGYYKDSRDVYAIAPGVMAQTGMETGQIIKGIIRESEAEVLIVIDALSARQSTRLNSTIQICNTGIMPGSGVGNHRFGIHEESMGIPVIAIGVPTVIQISTLIYDAFFPFVEDEIITKKEQEEFATKMLEPEISNLFVTPKDIDEAVSRISFTVSEGINQFICFRENQNKK